MGWDITLSVPGVDWATRDWDYTSNTSPMIELAIDRAGLVREFQPGSYAEKHRADGRPIRWKDMLDGMTGAQGVALLTAVVAEWDRDPDTFVAMDPPNGWGSLLPKGDGRGIRSVFVDMIEAASTEAPLVWSVT